jgi:hypothetical protein
VDEVVTDRDRLVQDVHREDQSRREFVEAHQDVMNFPREQGAQWKVDLMIFFAEDVRKSFLEIPFVTPSFKNNIYSAINKNILEK